MKKFILVFITLLFCVVMCHSQTYVSKQGSDRNTGTKEDPFRSITRACKNMESGTIYVMEGLYWEMVTIPDNVIVLAYKNDKATVNYIDLDRRKNIGITMKDAHRFGKLYLNKCMSDTARKMSCDTGYIGSVVIYTVYDGKHKADNPEQANYKALYDLTWNKQEYANKHGKCIKQ